MKVHKLASVFPSLREEDYLALKSSIEEIGLLRPITLLDGAILDGVHRQRACKELNIECRSEEFTGKDPVAFVIGENIARRHFSESQRAMTAARIAELRQGKRGKAKYKETNEKKDANWRLSEAASLLGVGVRTVNRANTVLERGVPGLVAAVDSGEIKVSRAADIAALEEREQLEAVAQPKSRTSAVRRGRQRRKERREGKTREDSSAKAFQLTATTPNDAPITLSQWRGGSRRSLFAESETPSKMNQQKSDDIEWAQWTWNPVTGCEHGCAYCYARDITEKRGGSFEPTIYPARLTAPRTQDVPSDASDDVAYRNIFTCSMADLFGAWVPTEWVERVLEEARRNPRWNFLCLTKFPQRAVEFDLPDNFWMGATVDRQERVRIVEKVFARVKSKTRWISCEPLLTPLRFERLDIFHWVVVGGASRTRTTPRWIPPLDWLAQLHQQVRAANLPIFYKSNTGLPDELRLREFPWQKRKTPTLPSGLK